MNNVELANRQTTHSIDESRLVDTAVAVLQGEDFDNAEISIAVVDSQEMHTLNRQFLDHDYPTDVLSFPLGGDGEKLNGEVVICADVAFEVAQRHEWTLMDELSLYLIHGTLHLVGYDDKSKDDRVEMYAREQRYLTLHNIGASNDRDVTLTRPDSIRRVQGVHHTEEGTH